MNIGQAAERTGLPAKTIRYYEDIGLIRPARQAANGYRTFSEQDIQTLLFIAHARGLGFSIKDVMRLLSLYGDSGRASADVKAVAEATIARIDRKVVELQSMRATLGRLIRACHGDERPACPILEGIAAVDLVSAE